ncbi:MAG: hypothetical protein NWQ23_08885 [Yoonia sp.]|uniref:hypothetical protein n=1 Tax=Yoonia sp. TaxID=2212373 RepID=UPI00273E7445|nr:hypothetical protein [Yoonia sp.]MDP5085520.1 hypothetical protein [Yoonia sp.]MDP5360540.1 hypothetical protein [Paracoccaceae bacterium]
MLILTHDTVRNPAILAVRQLPRKFFGRVTVWPKGKVGLRGIARIAVEFQWVRYTVSLLPLVMIGLVWNDLAMPLAQAPILMLVLIWWVEMRVLRVPKSKRGQIIDAADAERGLDLLRVQARAVLTQIAALRDLRSGQLHLVVEQSDLGLFAPLTYVTVQSEDGPAVLALTRQERDIIAQGLFQAPLDEGLLLRINQSQNTFLRDITLNARGVSAHARLAAALA